MNTHLIQIAQSIGPTPDSQLARAIEAVRERDAACIPFAKLLDQRQAEAAEAEHIIASAEGKSDLRPIEAALSHKAALAVVTPLAAAQLEGARADVQRAEATVSQIIQRARGAAQYIRELADPNTEVRGLSPARRQAELERQRAELAQLVGHESLEVADNSAIHAANLQAQVMANIQHHRAATV